MTIETDASTMGWGTCCGKFQTRGLWSQSERLFTHKRSRTSSRRVCPEIIPKKQVQYPCKTNNGQFNSNKLYKQNGWAHVIGPVKPSLRPLAMVSRMVHNSRSTPLARTIILNIVADFESRARPDTSDWQLDPSIFQGINNKWGPFTTDLFASRLTAQLPRFGSQIKRQRQWMLLLWIGASSGDIYSLHLP